MLYSVQQDSVSLLLHILNFFLVDKKLRNYKQITQPPLFILQRVIYSSQKLKNVFKAYSGFFLKNIALKFGTTSKCLLSSQFNKQKIENKQKLDFFSHFSMCITAYLT